MSKWIRCGVIAGWLLTAVLKGDAARAQIVTTTVQDTVTDASGAPATGSVVVSWGAFTTAAGTSVAAGSLSTTIGAGGVLQVALQPNAGATPMGSYYTADYHLGDGTVSREFWVVPVSVPGGGPAKLAGIRNQVLPTSMAMQTVSKQYVDTAIAKAVGNAPAGGTPALPFALTNVVPGQVLQDTSSSLVNANANVLVSATHGTFSAFSASLAGSGQTWMVFCFIGDSICAGNGPPNNDDSFPNSFASRIKREYGSAAVSPFAKDETTADEGTVTGGSCTPAYGAGPGNSNSSLGTVFNFAQRCPSGTTITFTVASGTDLGLLYYTYSDSTTPTVTIDGVAQSFAPAAATGTFTPHYIDFSGLNASAANHTVAFTMRGPFYPMFVLPLLNTTSGVIALNFAEAGATSFAYNGSLTNFLSVLPNLKLAVGGEWQNGGGTVAQVVANNQQAFANVPAGVTAALLITGPSSNTDSCTTAPCPADLVNALETFAAQNNLPTIDLFNRWGRKYAGGGQPMLGDGTHPNLAGSRDAASLAYEALHGFDFCDNAYNCGIDTSVSGGDDIATLGSITREQTDRLCWWMASTRRLCSSPTRPMATA